MREVQRGRDVKCGFARAATTITSLRYAKTKCLRRAVFTSGSGRCQRATRRVSLDSTHRVFLAGNDIQMISRETRTGQPRSRDGRVF